MAKILVSGGLFEEDKKVSKDFMKGYYIGLKTAIKLIDFKIELLEKSHKNIKDW